MIRDADSDATIFWMPEYKATCILIMEALTSEERAAYDDIMSSFDRNFVRNNPRRAFQSAIRVLNERRVMRAVRGGGSVRLIVVDESDKSAEPECAEPWMDEVMARADAMMK